MLKYVPQFVNVMLNAKQQIRYTITHNINHIS